MARTYLPAAGANYSSKIGQVVYKTANNTVTLATDIDGHVPCGVIVAAINETNGPVTVCDPGDRVLCDIDATATFVATSTFACLGANSGVTEETSTAYVVGPIVEPNPAIPREAGYIEIVFQPELNPAP